MQASSLAIRIKRCAAVREWAWWRLQPTLRLYVAVVPAVALAVIGIAAACTGWDLLDLTKFALLVCCGMVSVASTPRRAYAASGVVRDFSTQWLVPCAILLPPIYVALMPIPLIATLQLFVHRGVLYRRVFTAAATSLSYALASQVFREFPSSFAGARVGVGFHALTWALAVVACEIIGNRVHHFMIVGAVKLTDSKVQVWRLEWNREALQGLFVEIDLCVLITLTVALSPALVILALPTLLLVRRFLVYPILMAQSRVDSKTGLLNVSTWESEAETELSRATRNRHPLALALVDIDHFKNVNDTYGHLVGDRVLKTVAEALTSQSRDYDRAGRFGGEEFVLLLAQTGEQDACRIAERLRGYVAALAIPTDDRPDAPTIHVTISIGVTAFARGESFELTDLLAASDSAMYAAKQAGRNQVAFAEPLRDMGLDADWNSPSDSASSTAGTHQGAPLSEGTPLGGSPLSGHRVVLVQNEQTAASLCPRMSLSVPVRALHGSAMCTAMCTERARPRPAAAPESADHDGHAWGSLR
jgi:diguanylate cyclase (GGDEF)-like protein